MTTIFEDLKTFPPEDKGRVLDMLLNDLEEKTRYGHGTIWGTNQIVDRLENYVIRLGLTECPCCGRKRS